MSSIPSLAQCTDKERLFSKYRGFFRMPQNGTNSKIIHATEIDHPLLCININGINHPITNSIASKYKNHVRSIKFSLIITELGKMHIIAINLDSNDSWSKSKHFLIDNNGIFTVNKNPVNERYEFEASNDINILEPSVEQVKKFIENTLNKLIIHEGNIDFFDDLIANRDNISTKQKTHNEKNKEENSAIIYKTVNNTSTQGGDDMFNINFEKLDEIE